jgi:tripeptidyl-peptidase-2
VDKEEYTLRIHVRSEKADLLQKLTDMPLLISTKLSTAASLDVYSSHAQASTFGKKMSAAVVKKGTTMPFYVAALANDKYCKNATCGQYLSGVMSLAKVRKQCLLSNLSRIIHGVIF